MKMPRGASAKREGHRQAQDDGGDARFAMDFLQQARTSYSHLTQKLKSLKMAVDECRRNHRGPTYGNDDDEKYSHPPVNDKMELPVSIRFLKQNIMNDINTFKEKGFKFVRKSKISHKEKKQLMRLIKDLDIQMSDIDRCSDRQLERSTGKSRDEDEPEEQCSASSTFSFPALDTDQNRSAMSKCDRDDFYSISRSTIRDDESCSKSVITKSISRSTIREDDCSSLAGVKTPRILPTPNKESTSPSQLKALMNNSVEAERKRQMNTLPSLRVMNRQKTNLSMTRQQTNMKFGQDNPFSLPRMESNLANNQDTTKSGPGRLERQNTLVWKPYARSRSNLGYPFGGGFGDPPPLPKRQGTQFFVKP